MELCLIVPTPPHRIERGLPSLWAKNIGKTFYLCWSPTLGNKLEIH